MLAHFNEDRLIYGAEDGAANAATVASAVTGGGALAHGVHVCCCGYQGKVDARHWLAACRASARSWRDRRRERARRTSIFTECAADAVLV